MEDNDKEVSKIIENYYTLQEVQKLFRYKNRQSVYNLVHTKKLIAHKPTGKLLFLKEDVNKFMLQQSE